MLVVGGGVVGAGAALDAVTRGLSVGLVEARDFAAGTSSRSSKLIHGGLRYLEMLDFGLVREALRERGLLLSGSRRTWCGRCRSSTRCSTASGSGSTSAPGVALYDTMASVGVNAACRGTGTSPGAARCASRPALQKDALVGALQYYDAQVDDARHTMFLARTAAAYGAHVASRARGGRLPARGRAGHRRHGCTTSSTTGRSRSAPSR